MHSNAAGGRGLCILEKPPKKDRTPGRTVPGYQSLRAERAQRNGIVLEGTTGNAKRYGIAPERFFTEICEYVPTLQRIEKRHPDMIIEAVVGLLPDYGLHEDTRIKANGAIESREVRILRISGTFGTPGWRPGILPGVSDAQ
jgi:hypothetical protein